jgi:hypothetical protein
MTNSQFRVLFRVFLLRIVDLEIVAAEGDPVKLLGQFAALFAAISLLFSLPLIVMGQSSPEFSRETAHFLIATTMLVVGLLSVLNWDAAVPDRIDALVLSPLPVPLRIIFLAKLSALACLLGFAVLALNVFTGLLWPLYFASSANPVALIRSFVAHWIAMLLASCFMFFFVLTLRGLATQLLPYQLFLRVSAWIQMAAICVFLGTYILEPSLESPLALTSSANHKVLEYLPSYWFWGLFQQVKGTGSGTGGPISSIYVWLSGRAWIALAITVIGAAAMWMLSYRRSFRKIIEEPSIVSGTPWLRVPALPCGSLVIGITLFCFYTLMRSRFHRVILSFYLGAGLALVLVYIHVLSLLNPVFPANTATVSATYLGASILMMSLVIAGVRVLAGIPITLQANWTFRTAAIRAPSAYLCATRTALLLLSVLPVWLVSGAFFFPLRPWRLALAHQAILLLLGMILIELSLYRFHKIPFTCSYMPGKGNLQFVFWAFALILLPLIHAAARFELGLLDRPIALCLAVTLLAIILLCARTYNRVTARTLKEIQFDEILEPEIVGLHLDRSQS